MPEHIRALVVIVFLAIVGFYFAKKLVQKEIPATNFNQWKIVWLTVVMAAFLAHNFWLFVALSAILILKFTKGEKNKMALFFVLLFILPPIGAPIPGLGMVNYLFNLTYTRLIALLVLLPAALAIAHKNDFKFGKVWTDRFILLFALLIGCIQLRDRTFTDALRNTFYAFTDIYLPYYVASRSIKDLSQMNTVLYAFVTSAFVVAFMAIFEYLKHWLLYNPLVYALGVVYDYGNYIGRGGDLRAIASLSHPIVLGYFFTVALNFYFYLSTRDASAFIKKMGWLLILLGLFAALSRGPFVGAVASVLAFTLLSPNPMKKIGKLLLLSIVPFVILMNSPAGEKIYDLIPFVGEVDKDNVDYREKLFTNSMIVIDRYPIFGSANWPEEPEMIAMIQGEGIVDIVNSYIGLALRLGYVGLSLFVTIFACVIFAVFKSMRRIKDRNNPLRTLGASLLSTIVAIMIIIATTSSISTVPIIFWSVLGLGVAYARIVTEYLKTNNNMI